MGSFGIVIGYMLIGSVIGHNLYKKKANKASKKIIEFSLPGIF